jgi:drug/metabolite transporter (DMT)-like permease
VVSLLIIVFSLVLQDTVKKLSQNKMSGGAMTFSMGSIFFAFLVFLTLSVSNFSFSLKTLGFSILFAALYCVALVFGMLAILSGPLSITCLVTSLSLIIPTFYGLFVLKEPAGFSLYVGILLLCLSLVLINVEEKGEKKKLTFKWAVFAALSFLGNGGCSTVQKMQAVEQNGEYKNEFMTVALAISFAVVLIFALFKERKNMSANIKKGLPFFMVCGVANAVVNFLVIFLSSRLSAAVMFPLISAGGIILTCVVSVFLFKEKLSKTQWLGFILGVGAVVFLNL